VVHTGGVEIEISGNVIRLGQLLKFANVVTDGVEAKALIASGAVSVDGEPETRRGRQVSTGSLVEVDLPQGLQELRVVPQDPSVDSDETVRDSEPPGSDNGALPTSGRRPGGLAGAMPRTPRWLRH
jgi:ribosome-associated protein